MNPRARYGVDREAEAKGTVVEIDDMVFIVRSATAANRGYRYALAVNAAKHRPALSAGGAAAFDVHESILIESFADCVLLGWSNVDGPDGQPLPFTRENAVQLMEDCPELWDRLRDVALDIDRFRPAQEDGAALGKS
jgi:hypothetical protein